MREHIHWLLINKGSNSWKGPWILMWCSVNLQTVSSGCVSNTVVGSLNVLLCTARRCHTAARRPLQWKLPGSWALKQCRAGLTASQHSLLQYYLFSSLNNPPVFDLAFFHIICHEGAVTVCDLCLNFQHTHINTVQQQQYIYTDGRARPSRRG